MKEITQHLKDALAHCTDRGMKLPFIVCSASPNGSTLTMRVDEGVDPQFLAEHYEPEGFRTPINLMIVDQDGEAVWVVIAGGKTSFRH